MCLHLSNFHVADSQYNAQLEHRLDELDDTSKAWSQALAKVPLVLPNSHMEFAAAEQEAKQIANAVLTLPTGSIDETLARMDWAMQSLAGRLARLRRVVCPDGTESASLPDSESGHIGVVADDGAMMDDNEEDQYNDEIVDEKLIVDILVDDILQESKANNMVEEEEDSNQM
jgi:hypothetical protein